MKKINMILKGSMVIVFGLSSLFLTNQSKDNFVQTSYAAENNQAEIDSVKNSLVGKKEVFDTKITFANEFVKTRAYKETSSANKNKFQSDLALIKEAKRKVELAFANVNDLNKLKLVEESVEDASNTITVVLTDIYSQDSFLSKIVEANLAISYNKLESIPKNYRAEYLLRANMLKNEYENILFEYKIYNESQLKTMLENYQAVVKKINSKYVKSEKVEKIKKAIAKIEKKIEGIKFIKKNMPNSYKKYEKQIKAALTKAEKAINNAQTWIKNNDK